MELQDLENKNVTIRLADESTIKGIVKNVNVKIEYLFLTENGTESYVFFDSIMLIQTEQKE